MIILKIMLWIVAIAAVVGVIAGVADLFEKKSNTHKPYGPYERLIKRPLDAFLATGALIVLCPVLLVIAVLVRVKLGSPVLFTQDRPGRDGKVFKLYKFRSMTNSRDANGILLPDEQRLTKVGRFVRSTSIDEVPQLWNVLKGDMSLIGPRPLLVEYLPLYSPEQSRRHEVRPGITGWAQCHGRNAISWQKKFELDVWYVDHISFWVDLKIVFITIKKVFSRADISSSTSATMELFNGNN